MRNCLMHTRLLIHDSQAHLPSCMHPLHTRSSHAHTPPHTRTSPPKRTPLLTRAPHPPRRTPRAGHECAGSGCGAQPLPRSRRSRNAAASSRRCTLIIRTRSMGAAAAASPRSLPRPAGGAAGGYSPAPPRDMCGGGRPARPLLGALSPPAPPRLRPHRPGRAASSPRAVCLPLRASTGRGGSSAARPAPSRPSPCPLGNVVPPRLLHAGSCSAQTALVLCVQPDSAMAAGTCSHVWLLYRVERPKGLQPGFASVRKGFE